MESSTRAGEEEGDGEVLELSCEMENASLHGDHNSVVGHGEEGGTEAASSSPATPPSAANPSSSARKKRIWFGGKVTTHVQEFDRRKPASHVSRFLVFRSRSSSSIPSGREEEVSDAPLTPTRWESGTSSHRLLRDPRGTAADHQQQQGRGVRGSLMPFLPLRRGSSEETSSDDGSKGGRSGSGPRMREAVAYIEDPSAALRRESLDSRRSKATADDQDLSPKMPRRRGMVVTVDSPNVLKFTTPVNVSRESPRQPVRRSSAKDEDAGAVDGDCDRHDGAEAVGSSAVTEIKFLDLDDSTSSNVDDDDMQALERTVQTMAGPNPPRPVLEPASLKRWSYRRWSLNALPAVTMTASSGSSHSSSSSHAPERMMPSAPSSIGSGMRRWSLHAPGSDAATGSTGPSKASKSRDGRRRWTWNSSRVPGAS